MSLYLTDPILRAPAWGCMLMSLSASLMGAILFLRKKSLLAESLSHASYPGVVLSFFFLAAFFPYEGEQWVFFMVLLGAFLASSLALKSIEWLEKKGKIFPDTTLCFVLSVFFGAGLTAASLMQGRYPSWFKQVQMLLFGQVATMTDVHIVIYGSLSCLTALFLFFIYRPLQVILFDSGYAKSLGVKTKWIERGIFVFLLLSIIAGMRSVGVILMSGMLIAPAVAARQYTNRLSTMLILSALFGTLSALLGYILSVEASLHWGSLESPLSLPTGPLIVLVSVFWAFFSLCFAKRRGLVFRLARIFSFRLSCLQENVLKNLWKKKTASLRQLSSSHSTSFFTLRFVLWRMISQGWLKCSRNEYELTGDGYQKAAAIVRLHRLWEVYLTHYLGKEPESVHRNAEEMEHILTPDLERRPTELLADPQRDPHHQPIPGRKLL